MDTEYRSGSSITNVQFQLMLLSLAILAKNSHIQCVAYNPQKVRPLRGPPAETVLIVKPDFEKMGVSFEAEHS